MGYRVLGSSAPGVWGSGVLGFGVEGSGPSGSWVFRRPKRATSRKPRPLVQKKARGLEKQKAKQEERSLEKQRAKQEERSQNFNNTFAVSASWLEDLRQTTLPKNPKSPILLNEGIFLKSHRDP